MADEKRIPTEAEYITMIGKKTAALFDVSCAMGAISATNKPKDISNLSAFGRNLGIAFQITSTALFRSFFETLVFPNAFKIIFFSLPFATSTTSHYLILKQTITLEVDLTRVTFRS